MQGIAPLIIALCVILMPLVWFIATFNSLVRVCQQVRESWADIDVELKRRYELIPNLVETVKGYAKHEREVLELVIQLRNKAMANDGPASRQAVDETALQIGMKRLFAVAEAYPTLKADAHFLALQQRRTRDLTSACGRIN